MSLTERAGGISGLGEIINFPNNAALVTPCRHIKVSAWILNARGAIDQQDALNRKESFREIVIY